MPLLAFACLLLAAAPTQNPPGAPAPDGNKLVKLELVSERAKIHPGEHFTLAAKLTVTPHWHIYWGENPGDTGIPTRVEIETPKEFTLGPAQFPVPARHEEPGPLVSYTYEGEVLVLFDAVAPAKLEPGSKARFALSASWLVCISRCFDGAGEAALELECAAAGDPVPANEALFKNARAKLPRKLSELAKLEAQLLGDPQKPNECHLDLVVPGALGLEFIPGGGENPAFDSATEKREGADVSLSVRYRFQERPKGKLQVGCPGILSVKTKDGPVHYWFDKKFDVGF